MNDVEYAPPLSTWICDNELSWKYAGLILVCCIELGYKSDNIKEYSRFLELSLAKLCKVTFIFITHGRHFLAMKFSSLLSHPCISFLHSLLNKYKPPRQPRTYSNLYRWNKVCVSYVKIKESKNSSNQSDFIKRANNQYSSFFMMRCRLLAPLPSYIPPSLI